MSMMLYKDFISNVNENPVKDISDETIQAAIYDWFKYRYIGFENTDKFLDILQRNVKVNYPMYQQKLRIEPGISQYDWLVSLYRERQLKSVGDNSKQVAYNSNLNATLSHDNTKTNDLADVTTKTGTVTDLGSDNHTHGKSGVDSVIRSGGHTETDVAGLHTTTNSPHVKRVRSEDGGESAWSGDSQINAQLPMSKSYTDAEFDSDGNKTGGQIIEPDKNSTEKQYYQKAYQHMPALDWNTATSQAQSGHREYHDSDHKVTDSYEYDSGVTGDINTTQGDSNNPDTKKLEYNNETTATNYGNSLTISGTDSNTRTYDTTDSLHKTGNIKDIGTGTNDIAHTGNDTTTAKDNRTDREQVTGRNEDPATLLARATAFIERSSAWIWFREQIDCCFYPGYYTDDVTEEGSSLI